MRRETQARLERLMTAFENSTYIATDMSSSWLRDFLGFVERNRGYSELQLDITTEQQFVSNLRNIYLADPSSPLSLGKTRLHRWRPRPTMTI